MNSSFFYPCFLGLCLPLFFVSCAVEDMSVDTGEVGPVDPNKLVVDGVSQQQPLPQDPAPSLAQLDEAARQSARPGTAVPGKPGHVISPFSGKELDVVGHAVGTLLRDPTYVGEGYGYLRVPADAVAVPAPAPPPVKSSNGIVGTWSNEKATWRFSFDGMGTVSIPSTNGTLTTHLKWNTRESGKFAYTITKVSLSGSDPSDGGFDYGEQVNKSYTENYSISGDTLILGRETLTRN